MPLKDPIARTEYQKRRKSLPHVKEYQKRAKQRWIDRHPEQARLSNEKKRYKYARSIRGRYKCMKEAARKRNIEVQITLEQYEILISVGTCIYGCGRSLPEAGGGIDRKDSALGYALGNCVPCCEVCNEMKGYDNISYEEMFEVTALLVRLRQKYAV